MAHKQRLGLEPALTFPGLPTALESPQACARGKQFFRLGKSGKKNLA